MTKKKLNTLLNERIKILLIFLLILYPTINFITINLNQEKFISTLFLYTVSFISFFFLLIFFLFFYFFGKRVSLFKIFFPLLFFWNLQFYFYDIKKFLITFVTDIFDGYAALLMIFFISFFLYKLTIEKKFFLRFVLFFLLISISINFVNNFSFDFFKKNSKKINTINPEQRQNLDGLGLNTKPNVFYIITDGLGSFSNLNKYGIDTVPIENYLKNNNYQISYNSKSSYTETELTLTSIFYLDYIVDGIDKFYSIDALYYPFFEKEQDLPLVNKLSDIGYKFYRIENNLAKCRDHIKMHCFKTMDKNLINKLINDYSLEVFFSKSLVNSIIQNYFFRIKNNPFFVDGYDAIHQYKDILKKNTNILDVGGNFTFIHHIGPHRPMRDKNCGILNNDEKMIFSYKNYKSSVQCVFKRIKEFNEIILNKYPNSIIVIQGDHGPTFEDNKNMGSSKMPNMKYINDRINIFNAAYLPEKCKNNFNKSLGTVGTIRLILHCIGDKTIDLDEKSKTFMFFPFEKPNIININSLKF